MPNASMPPGGALAHAEGSIPLLCPNPACRGALAALAGAEDLYCAGCGAVVVILGPDRAVWLRRHAEPQSCSLRALRAPAMAS